MESKSLNLHSQLNYACDLDSCNDVVLKVLKIESVKDNAEYSVTTTEPLIGQKGQGKADDVIVYCKSILSNTFH